MSKREKQHPATGDKPPGGELIKCPKCFHLQIFPAYGPGHEKTCVACRHYFYVGAPIEEDKNRPTGE